MILDMTSELNFENRNKMVPMKKPVLLLNSFFFYQQQRT